MNFNNARFSFIKYIRDNLLNKLPYDVNLYAKFGQVELYPAIVVIPIADNPSEITGMRDLHLQISVFMNDFDDYKAGEITEDLYKLLDLESQVIQQANLYNFDDPKNPKLTASKINWSEKSGIKPPIEDKKSGLVHYNFEVMVSHSV